MKAWELTRDLLRNTEPVVRSAEEQTWDASAHMNAQDFAMSLFWKSKVPGSAAPENLMAGALQSLESKGFVLAPYEVLLREGIAVVEKGDFERLYTLDMRLRVLMRAARPDPQHPSQKTVRYRSWDEFDATVTWPADAAIDVGSEDFADRIRGGWLAQLVGAAAGTALEGYSAENIMKVFGPIRGYVREPNTYNDDITFEIAFLEAFAEKGHAVTGVDISERWTSLIPMAWSAEAVALANIRRGLVPPETATTDNPFDEWIGAQMRGTICGMVAPGLPREAARLAWIDGEISHAANGILGEVFNAVLAARAFSEPDANRLLESTIALFSTESEYGQVLAFALDACRTSPDWQSAWSRCDERYVEYNWIHVYPNAAAQVVALWFGKGDFDRTLEIVCGIGHDVDCNAAQILCVLAIQQGSGIIDQRWSAPLLAGDIVTYMRRPATIPFGNLVAQTVDAVRKWHW
ncbi:ADP-ribosylglycohydrolase family protein [Mesorhizobium sp. BAC0120]|uniref:ADP-ribosylglycohydrolase family protein n=1 Tax=Mesorhizobium sp. BAC0120 TaxID=3090670 RepID=UPI00298CC463|nr:ADP-ribosylglycohydrolase family protein [Mesorhizobium sp. BAC0120]MDW6023539.1 ADP-ribosylglycohydrolase family protein [Mesorhizobium sp. BAC0120]